MLKPIQEENLNSNKMKKDYIIKEVKNWKLKRLLKSLISKKQITKVNPSSDNQKKCQLI